LNVEMRIGIWEWENKNFKITGIKNKAKIG